MQQNYTPPAPSTEAPPPPKRSFWRRKVGCMSVWMWSLLAAIILVIVIASCAGGGGSSSSSSTNTQAPAAKPKATQAPAVTRYPPTTEADLHGLAAQGDASAIHEFHSESVGLTGACPQPKREVTVAPSLTGRQLAEDLLAYFYAQQLNSPCGSLVVAYHNQSEAGDAYTAGRISLDATDSSGSANIDPNATNLKYTLTLDIGGIDSNQEYVVSW